MKDDVSDILSTLKKANPFDIFLISFVALPFIYNTWISVFEKLGWNTHMIFWSLVFLFVIYIIGIYLLVSNNQNTKRKEIAKDLLVSYLQTKNFRAMSFDRVREKMNRSYNDGFLEQVIISFPQDLLRAKLKGGKPGVSRVPVIEIDTEEE